MTTVGTIDTSVDFPVQIHTLNRSLFSFLPQSPTRLEIFYQFKPRFVHRLIKSQRFERVWQWGKVFTPCFTSFRAVYVNLLFVFVLPAEAAMLYRVLLYQDYGCNRKDVEFCALGKRNKTSKIQSLHEVTAMPAPSYKQLETPNVTLTSANKWECSGSDATIGLINT